MAAITREEQYLAYLNRQGTTIPFPVTRKEQYLYELCMNGGLGGGTSINILGELVSTSELPSADAEKGDAYIINEELWVYSGSTLSSAVNGFSNCGRFTAGNDGQDGKDGEDGKTPYIDPATKHWFIDGVDTGVLAEGLDGSDGKSAYEIWLDEGNSGTVADFLDSLVGEDGDNGKSAYELWLEQGNTGTEEDFVRSLKGADGTMSFDDLTEEQKESLKGDEGFSPVITENVDNTEDVYALDIETKDGTFTTPNLKGGVGAEGKSAYQVWLDAGNTGTEQDFLDALVGEQGDEGKSAYQTWLDEGNAGTEEDFFNSLKGDNGFSPVVTVEEIEGGHKVIIEDENGPQEFEVKDGVNDKEIIHTDLTGFDGVTTVLGLVNALLEEYRAERKNVRFECGSLSNTNLTDLPQAYGYLTIKVGGTNIVEVTFAYSNVGFKAMYYGYLNRTSSETLYSSLTWKVINTDSAMKSYSSLADLELDTTATINDIVDKMANNSMFVYKTDVFDLSQYENLQYATVTIIKQSANRVQAIMTDKDTGILYVGYMNSSNKFVGWNKLVVNEIIHTDLSGNLEGITTVLDLVNALLTEYRASSPKKPVRFISGEITKTTLTDLPVTYGVLQITVAGWDVAEVRLAHSANGFKSMYYGFLTRITGQESISSIAWEKVATTVTELSQLGLTSSATLNDVYDKLGIGQTALLSVQDFNDYQTLFPYSVDSDKYARVEIHKGASTAHSRVMWFMKNGSRMALGNIGSGNTIVGWVEYATKDYVDNGGTFNGKTVKTVTIDLSANDLNATYSGLNKMKLDNYISGSANVIRAEGYYNPPSDASGYVKSTVQAYTDQKVGNIFYENGSWQIGVAGSTGGKKGSGYAKLYYVD